MLVLSIQLMPQQLVINKVARWKSHVIIPTVIVIVMARWGSRHVTVHMTLHTTTPVVTAPHRVESQFAGTRERPLQTHTSHYNKASVTKQLH